MPTDPASGRVPEVQGFDQLREIGRGGSSTVYSARQIQLGRPVAIKVLHVALDDESARRRFERECSVIGTLGDSPGIVAVYDAAFTADGRGCIVMRLMRESLAETLRRDGPLDASAVREIGLTACTALGHAHRRWVIHRDLKPANLLVSEFDEVALADFDIASVGSRSSSTQTNDSMSPPHAPPERLGGDGGNGPATDIWSLGSTLYTLLAGAPPFGTATSDGGMAGLVHRVLHDSPPPIGRADVPPELEAVLRRALHKDPAERWPDVASMRAALQSVELRADANPHPPASSGAPSAAQRPDVTEPSGATVHPEPATPAGSATPGRRVGDAMTTAIVLLAVVVAVVATLVLAFR